MATFTISVTGLTARSKTISAGDATRLLTAYRHVYGTGLTDQQVFDAFADGTFAYMQQAVLNDERAVADAAIAKIVLT